MFRNLSNAQKAIWKQWTKISSGSPNRGILGAILSVGCLAMCAKLFSIVKESLVAAFYGTGNAYDAFVVASLIPTIVVGLVSESLNAALIPTYIEIRERDDIRNAHQLYTTVLMLNTILLFSLALILAISADLWLPLMASGFSPEKLGIARNIFYCSLPLIIITGFSTTWGAVLNAAERFTIVATVPTVHPVSIIIVLILMHHSVGIYALVAGAIIGAGFEAALLGTALAKHGHPLLPKWHGLTAPVIQVMKQYGACIGAAFLVSGTSLVDQGMASMLGPRSNSALAYGSKVVGLIMNLGASSVATVILPHLSKLTALEDWKGLRRFLRVYLRLIMGTSILFTIILFVFSSSVIRLLYERGAFSEADTALVTQIQSFYILRIPISATGVLITRTITALKANHLLTAMSVATFVLNASFNYLFMHKYGIAGIALSTTVCSAVAFVCLGFALRRQIYLREDRR